MFAAGEAAEEAGGEGDHGGDRPAAAGVGGREERRQGRQQRAHPRARDRRGRRRQRGRGGGRGRGGLRHPGAEPLALLEASARGLQYRQPPGLAADPGRPPASLGQARVRSRRQGGDSAMISNEHFHSTLDI